MSQELKREVAEVKPEARGQPRLALVIRDGIRREYTGCKTRTLMCVLLSEFNQGLLCLPVCLPEQTFGTDRYV